jgi:cytoskeletal protein RodZ
LSKSPEKRYQTGAELLEILAAALQPGQSAMVDDVIAPASLGPDQTERSVTSVEASAPSKAGKRSLIYAGVGLAVVLVIGLILIALLAALFFWPGGTDSAAETASPQTAVTESASVGQAVAATPTESSSKPTSTPLPAPAAVTPQEAAQAVGGEASQEPAAAPAESPTPAGPANYTLVVAKHGEDSLFVVNQTEVPFPMTRLSLRKGKESINGEEWRVESLASGACVTAWKEEGGGNRKDNDKKAPQAPEGVTCNPVGERLTRKGKERFWKETFEVYFDQAQVGTCQKNQDICPITIPLK